MDELEFALETIDGQRFEDFVMAFLREEGYDVHESGGAGADGGWDARIELGERNGIAHASKRKDWKRKLREDAEKVEQLEEERDEEYDLLLFVTNQRVTGQQELKMEDEIQTEYGWRLKLLHRDNILGELRQNHQQLAEKYLDTDLQRDSDHIADIEELVEERLSLIQQRDEEAEELEPRPAVVLHIIPNGIFSQSKVRSAGKIPDPSVLYERHSYPETRGKSTIAYGNSLDSGKRSSYGLIRNDGLYETASRSAIRTGTGGDLWIRGSIESTGMGLDAHVVLTTRDIVSKLAKMGFSGSAFVFLSFLDASEVKLHRPDRNKGIRFSGPSTFGSDFYTTEYGTVQIGSDEVIADLEPVLSEIWRQFGQEDGTENIEDGEWARQNIRINGETILGEGDR